MLASNFLMIPEVIDHTTPRTVIEALAKYEHLFILCDGPGGSIGSARTICAAIRYHGHVTGIILGESNSAHSLIWSSCQTRYAAPYAIIGIHMVSWDFEHLRLDAQVGKLIGTDYGNSDNWQAEIYAGASDQPVSWWKRTLKTTGSGHLRDLEYQWLKAHGMARILPPELRDEIFFAAQPAVVPLPSPSQQFPP